MRKTNYSGKSIELIIIGASSGGINALKPLLSALPEDFPVPVILVMHRMKNVRSYLDELFQSFTKLKVREAGEKEKITAGNIYLAPSNYHLLFEDDRSFSLSVDEAVNFSRPSLDVSFVSAGEVFKENLLAIVLSGANEDGAKGVLSISENGGEIWVQDPEEAQVATMPAAALKWVPDAKKMSLEMIAEKIVSLGAE